MNKIIRVFIFYLVLILLFVEPLSAQIQIEITPEKDATISSINPNLNMGTSNNLIIQSLPNGERVVTFLYFNLSSVPPNVTINSAYLSLYCYSKTNNPIVSIGHRIFSTWSETAITWNNSPGFSSTVSSNANIVNVNTYNSYDVSGMVSQWYTGFLNAINNGFVIQCGNIDENSATFYSKEGTYVPKLIINYTIIPSAPELLLPVNGSTDNPINPIFTWKSSKYANSYEVDVSTFSNFSYYKSNLGITDTTVQITNLYSGTKYYWRVNATNSAGSSQYSNIWSFTTAIQSTLTVSSSNPNNGVNISVSPADNNNQGNGSTQFTRTYKNGTVVTLTAPATASGNNFQKWQRNGSDYSTIQSISFSIDAEYSFTAVYQMPTRTLTVLSSNPNSGVNITVSPADNNNQGNGSTQFTRVYNNGTNINLTAPATANGNNFQKWQRNGSDYSNNQSISFVIDDGYTFAAVYQTPVRTLTVSSLNPNSGVNISANPTDNNNQGNGTSQFIRQYNNGTNINLTAPSTVNGNNFQKWQRNSSDYSNNQSISFTIDADYTLTAIYQTPTSVDRINGNLVTEYLLHQNYPNPFNPTTTINYSVPKSSFVTIKVYDVLGREAAALVNEEKQAGNYKIDFDASKLASGVYFYRIQAGASTGSSTFVETKKLVLMK